MRTFDPALLEACGIPLVKAVDGTVDAIRTVAEAVSMLRLMPDPTERALRGHKLFGKGWAAVVC